MGATDRWLKELFQYKSYAWTASERFEEVLQLLGKTMNILPEDRIGPHEALGLIDAIIEKEILADRAAQVK